MGREKHESFLSEIRSHVNAESGDELWAGMDLEGLKEEIDVTMWAKAVCEFDIVLRFMSRI